MLLPSQGGWVLFAMTLGALEPVELQKDPPGMVSSECVFSIVTPFSMVIRFTVSHSKNLWAGEPVLHGSPLLKSRTRGTPMPHLSGRSESLHFLPHEFKNVFVPRTVLGTKDAA